MTRRRSELTDPLAPLYALLSQLTSSAAVLSGDVTGALAAAVRQLAGQVTAATARASVTKLTAATAALVTAAPRDEKVGCAAELCSPQGLSYNERGESMREAYWCSLFSWDVCLSRDFRLCLAAQ